MLLGGQRRGERRYRDHANTAGVGIPRVVFVLPPLRRKLYRNMYQSRPYIRPREHTPVHTSGIHTIGMVGRKWNPPAASACCAIQCISPPSYSRIPGREAALRLSGLRLRKGSPSARVHGAHRDSGRMLRSPSPLAALRQFFLGRRLHLILPAMWQFA